MRVRPRGHQSGRGRIAVAAADVVACDLDGETVLLQLKDGVYYSLDRVASSVWRLIQTPAAVGDVHRAMLREYDVEPGRCERDLRSLLGNLADRGLVELRDRP